VTQCLDVIRLDGSFKLIISLWSADIIYVQTCKFLITPVLGGRLLPVIVLFSSRYYQVYLDVWRSAVLDSCYYSVNVERPY